MDTFLTFLRMCVRLSDWEFVSGSRRGRYKMSKGEREQLSKGNKQRGTGTSEMWKTRRTREASSRRENEWLRRCDESREGVKRIREEEVEKCESRRRRELRLSKQTKVFSQRRLQTCMCLFSEWFHVCVIDVFDIQLWWHKGESEVSEERKMFPVQFVFGSHGRSFNSQMETTRVTLYIHSMSDFTFNTYSSTQRMSGFLFVVANLNAKAIYCPLIVDNNSWGWETHAPPSPPFLPSRRKFTWIEENSRQSGQKLSRLFISPFPDWLSWLAGN